MSKKLSDMSLEQLWNMFPIFLTEHQTVWKDWFEEEKILLQEILPEDKVISIHHIGSTAIATIWAKPIIDILVEVKNDCNLKDIKDILVANGYLDMNQDDRQVSLNKGYTEQGFDKKVFHIHVQHEGDNDQLYFRDYLIEHPEVAKEYETMKLYLWTEYEHDRDGYTNAKLEFVTDYTKKARLRYQDRYINE